MNNHIWVCKTLYHCFPGILNPGTNLFCFDCVKCLSFLTKVHIHPHSIITLCTCLCYLSHSIITLCTCLWYYHTPLSPNAHACGTYHTPLSPYAHACGTYHTPLSPYAHACATELTTRFGSESVRLIQRDLGDCPRRRSHQGQWARSRGINPDTHTKWVDNSSSVTTVLATKYLYNDAKCLFLSERWVLFLKCRPSLLFWSATASWL